MTDMVEVKYNPKTNTYIINHKGRVYFRDDYFMAKYLIDKLTKGGKFGINKPN